MSLTVRAGHDPWCDAPAIVRLPRNAFVLQPARRGTAVLPITQNVVAARQGLRGFAVTRIYDVVDRIELSRSLMPVLAPSLIITHVSSLSPLNQDIFR